MNRIQISILLFCLMLSITFVTLVRRNKLREKYIGIWTLALSFAFFCTFNSSLISDMSGYLGFALPSNFILVLIVIFVLVQDLHHSIELTKSEKRLESSAIKIAELQLRIEKLES